MSTRPVSLGSFSSCTWRQDADPLNFLLQHFADGGLDVGRSLRAHESVKILRINIGTKILMQNGQLLVEIVERLANDLLIAKCSPEQEQLP